MRFWIPLVEDTERLTEALAWMGYRPHQFVVQNNQILGRVYQLDMPDLVQRGLRDRGVEDRLEDFSQ